LVEAIDRRLRFVEDPALRDLVDDADNRVPVPPGSQRPELEALAQRRPAGIGALHELLVHDRRGSRGLPIVRGEEPAFAQLRADGREVVAADVAYQCDLAGRLRARLPFQQVERRIGEISEWNEID